MFGCVLYLHRRHVWLHHLEVGRHAADKVLGHGTQSERCPRQRSEVSCCLAFRSVTNVRACSPSFTDTGIWQGFGINDDESKQALLAKGKSCNLLPDRVRLAELHYRVSIDHSRDSAGNGRRRGEGDHAAGVGRGERCHLWLVIRRGWWSPVPRCESMNAFDDAANTHVFPINPFKMFSNLFVHLQ